MNLYLSSRIRFSFIRSFSVINCLWSYLDLLDGPQDVVSLNRTLLYWYNVSQTTYSTSTSPESRTISLTGEATSSQYEQVGMIKVKMRSRLILRYIIANSYILQKNLNLEHFVLCNSFAYITWSGHLSKSYISSLHPCRFCDPLPTATPSPTIASVTAPEDSQSPPTILRALPATTSQ